MAYNDDEFLEWIMKRDFKAMADKIREERETKNYFRFSDFSLLFRYYAYVDLPEYYADDYIKKRKIFILYGHEMVHPKHSYRVIFCKIPKWQEHKFEKAMEELKTRILIGGHTDYIERCKEIADKMDKTPRATDG